MKTKKNMLFIGAFIVYIYGFFFVQIFDKDVNFSEIENRVLEKVPSFSLKSLVKDKYTKEFETYLQDHFPQRDNFVGVKSYIDMRLGKKDNNGVYLGDNGFLLEKFEEPDYKLLKKNIGYINGLGSELKTYFMLVPTATNIYGYNLPRFASTHDENKFISTTLNGLDKGVFKVPLLDEFHENAKSDRQLFYRTDHHWTTYGAYLGYKQFCKTANIKENSLDEFEVKSTPDFLGSLYSKGNFTFIKSDEIEIFNLKPSLNSSNKLEVTYLADNKKSNSLYEKKYLSKKDKYSVFLGGNHPAVVIKTGLKNGKKLVVVKDSFANSMVPFLTSHYEEIHILDIRFLNMKVKDYSKYSGISEALVLYNAHGFAKEKSLSLLK